MTRFNVGDIVEWKPLYRIGKCRWHHKLGIILEYADVYDVWLFYPFQPDDRGAFFVPSSELDIVSKG
tara:strand:- start:610 stop:810 length:201 start_codon:yes stop_codon:yes gene_type:complete